MSSENAASQDSVSQRGAFAFVKEISSGSISSTWLARVGDESPADAAASVRLTEVLRVNSHVTEKPDVKDGFVRDVQQAQNLKHPNIVSVEASVSEGKELHIATQIVEGSTLFALFAAAGTDGLGTDVLLRIGLDVLSALSAAHALKPQALAHGELTPQHIVVGSDGISRVSGFGVARALARVDPTGAKNQTRLGYAAPERVKTMAGPGALQPGAQASVDPRSDLFSVAVMLWEGIAKQRLFSAKMDAAVIQKVLTAPIAPLASLPKVSVPPSVDAALLKALEREPSRRYQTADEFIAALQKAGDAAIASHEKVASLVEKFTGRTIAARRAELASALVAPAVTPPPLKETTVSAPNPSAPKTSVPMPSTAAKTAATPAAAKPLIPMPPGASSNKASVPPPPAAAAVKTAIPAAAKVPAPAAAEASALPAKRPMAATLVGMPPAQDASKNAAKGGKTHEIIDEATLDGEWLEDAAGGGTGQIPAPPAVPKIGAPAAKAAAPSAPKTAPAVPAAAKAPAAPSAPKTAPIAAKPAAPAAAKAPAPKTSPPAAPKPAAPKPAADAAPGKAAAETPAAEAKAPPAAAPAKAPIAAPKPAAPKPAAPSVPAARKAAAPAPKAAETAPSAETASAAIPEAPAGDIKITLETPQAAADMKGVPSEVDVHEASPDASKGVLRADAHDRISTGTTLGRYEVLMPVAKGGMASVWAARIQGTRGFKKIVAVKTMLPDVSDDPEFESMFLDEARVAARIRHPNVVEIHDLGEENDVLYIVMEWVDGETLTTLMKAAKPKGGVPLPIMLRIASQICAGLHAAHELRDDADVLLDLVHRDVSPGNVLVSSTGFVKVADFGIAKSKGRLHETRASGVLKGKAPYLSPEQLRGLQPDRRSDLFAVGTVLYVMASGLHPFRGASEAKTMENIALMRPVPLREINPSIHAEFEKIIFKALEKDRNNRYTTAAEMQRAIDHLASSIGQPTTDEDVGAFVQSTIGDLIRERAKGLRAAITAVDGPLSTSRPSYPSIDPKAVPTVVGAEAAEAAAGESEGAKAGAQENKAPVEEDVTFDEEPLEAGQAGAAEAKPDEAKAGEQKAPEKADAGDAAKAEEPAANAASKEGVSAEALIGLLAASAAASGTAATGDENKLAEAKPAIVEPAFNVAALSPPSSSESALAKDEDLNPFAPKKRKPLPFIVGGVAAAAVVAGIFMFSGGSKDSPKTTAESAASTAVPVETAAPTAQAQPEKTAEAAPQPAETAAAAATQAPTAEATAAPEPSAEAAPPPVETTAAKEAPPVAAVAPKPKVPAPANTPRPPPTRPTPPKTTPTKTNPKKYNPSGI